ncbi:uncharacterized protein LOC134827465 isoform X2 [Culicoides brevitarsis]|uniref:uncharacterized protein LOC134827465 isoform X2 n=1 Tax=Culicoides brevitarsis TaxID=469753 RepID=UPI00307BD31F
MKNYVCYFGLLLLGVTIANGQFSFPGLPKAPKLDSFLNPKASFNPPSLPGGPTFSMNVSGSAGSNIENLMNPKLPQLPGLSGGNSNSNNPFGLPSLPGMPQLPGMPKLSDVPSLSGFSGFNSSSNSSSSFGSLPGMPNFFDSNGFAKLMPNSSNFANSNSTVGDALNSLENAVKRANDSANQALSNFQNFGNHLGEQIKNASEAAQSRMSQQLQGLSSGVRNCVEKNGNPGQAGVQAAQDSAVQCVQKKVEEAVGIVSNTRNDFQAAQQNLDYIRENLANCQVNVSMSLTDLPKFNSSSPSCVASALFSIEPENIFNLATDAAQAVGLVQGLKTYAMKCLANMMGNVAKASLENTLAIGKCYADLGNNY